MKTAIYIEDGVVQLVLTPESEFEKNAIKSFSEKPTETKIMTGTFYDCNGGWSRWKKTYSNSPYGGYDNEDQSLIMRIVESDEIKRGM